MNVKKGDLAYIVRDFWEENLGHTVEVLELVPPLPQFGPGNAFWAVKSTAPLKLGLYVGPPVEFVHTYYGTDAVCADEDLRPITPPALAQDTDTEQPIEETDHVEIGG